MAAGEMNAQCPARQVGDRQLGKPTELSTITRLTKDAKPNASRTPRARHRAPLQNPDVLTSDMCRRLGANPRSARCGPELDLVISFLNGPLFAAPPRCDVAVFQEPRLASGFPDLVVVFWRRDIAQNWKSARTELHRDDIRLAQYLHQTGPTMMPDLHDSGARHSLRSLERLHAAGLVEPKHGAWALRPLSEIFAIEQLIAVEAKVSEWRAGLEQAWLNTWFASDSYLLVPHVPRGSALLEQAKEIGIGVWTEQGQVIAPTCRPKLPTSYASWLFNEWVGRIPFLANTNGKRS